ncbi:MAG: hypothetical protein NZT61_05350 [Deltaproteobacteria bacterium]|nr:hypothetical protein [Deltaproteobacteria bacterium]
MRAEFLEDGFVHFYADEETKFGEGTVLSWSRALKDAFHTVDSLQVRLSELEARIEAAKNALLSETIPEPLLTKIRENFESWVIKTKRTLNRFLLAKMRELAHVLEPTQVPHSKSLKKLFNLTTGDEVTDHGQHNILELVRETLDDINPLPVDLQAELEAPPLEEIREKLQQLTHLVSKSLLGELETTRCSGAGVILCDTAVLCLKLSVSDVIDDVKDYQAIQKFLNFLKDRVIRPEDVQMVLRSFLRVCKQKATKVENEKPGSNPVFDIHDETIACAFTLFRLIVRDLQNGVLAEMILQEEIRSKESDKPEGSASSTTMVDVRTHKAVVGEFFLTRVQNELRISDAQFIESCKHILNDETIRSRLSFVIDLPRINEDEFPVFIALVGIEMTRVVYTNRGLRKMLGLLDQDVLPFVKTLIAEDLFLECVLVMSYRYMTGTLSEDDLKSIVNKAITISSGQRNDDKIKSIVDNVWKDLTEAR